MLDQVEERLLAPLDVVEDKDERRLLLEQLAERPGDLLRRRPRLRLPQQRTDRRRGGRIRGRRVELLQHLDDRPVGDPDPVGEAAAADDRRLDHRQRLGRQPRLAETRVGDDRDQLAAPLRQRPRPGLAQQRQLALAADEDRLVPPLGRRAGSEQPVGGQRLALALQHAAARAAPRRPPRRRARSVASAISTSPGEAACCKRAATFSASPVARRSSVPVTTSPVLTPIRPSIPSPANASRISTAARQARKRIVLVHDRHPEHRHHRIADELLHRAAVLLDDRPSSARNSGPAAPAAPPDPSTPPAPSSRPDRRTAPSPPSGARPSQPPSGAAHASQNLAASLFS